MNLNVRNRFRLEVLLLAMTVGSVAAAHAQEERKAGQSRFKARDVRGLGFSCSGAVVASDVLPVGPFAQVGQVTCDGVDTCEGTATGSFNGLILSLGLTGTYTVNPNGTGFVLYDLTIEGQPAASFRSTSESSPTTVGESRDCLSHPASPSRAT